MTAAAPKVEATAPASPTERSVSKPRWRRLLHDIGPVAGAALLFVVAWQAIVIIGDYPAYILPGPAVVAERFISGWTGGIIGPHFWTTLSEVLLGLTVGGMVVGFALTIGYFVGLEWASLSFKKLQPFMSTVYDERFWGVERHWKVADTPLTQMFRAPL